MKRALLTVVFAGSAALAASGAAGGQLPTLPRDVPMAGAGFPGAPPAFEIPHGGKVEIVEGGTDERTFILRRADGTRFAEARVIRGRTRTALFYNEVGTLTLATHALWPDESRLNLRRISASGAGPGRRAAYCSPDDRYNGHYWKINAGVTFKWYFVSGSTPSGMSVDTTET